MAKKYELKRGYVQIYTGDGKGKTTAALGLLLRAVGAGLRVYCGQFIKRGDFSEILAIRERFPEVTLEQYGEGCFLRGRPTAKAIRLARAGLKRLQAVLKNACHDVVIADEANCAVACGLLTADDLIGLIDARPSGVELVFTGRGADPSVIARADLVTEMREIRHYHHKRVKARRGIEM